MFPEKTYGECVILDAAYFKAFPNVKNYQNYCYERAKKYEYTSNLFGVKYYNVSGFKLINMLIQGSCAFLLKEIVRRIDEFILQNNLKSKLILTVHDEVILEIAKNENWIIPKIKEMMEDFPDIPIPLVAEVEESNTNWAEKHE